MTTAAVDRGRALEQQIAGYFARHGYQVRTNVVLTGRSGGRHEIDVLAEKTDALTTYRVAVECKAHQQPIEKDVISKLDYVMRDTGLNKGVVVSLTGCRVGAEQAARALGIDVWGPVELQQHLGPSTAAVLQVGAPQRLAWGFPMRADPAKARIVAEGQGKGLLGLRQREQLLDFRAAWLPAYMVHLTVTVPLPRATRWSKDRVGTSDSWNFYEALTGRRMEPPPAGDQPVEVDVSSGGIPPLIRDTQIAIRLREAIAAYRRVSRPDAVARHAAVLQSAGLPVPVREAQVQRTDLVYLPIYVGLLQAATAQRVVVINGFTGELSEAKSKILTGQLGHLRAAFSA
jgi:hypothetical protein